jgi:amino-acid N-acetyltransferase
MRSEPARPEDRDAILELLRQAELPIGGLAEDLRGFRVVRDASRIAAVCGLEVHGRYGLLRSLVVDAHRGRGLADMLVRETVESARARGLESVYLLTTTARDYFRRQGFADCRREEAPDAIRASWEFRSGCPASSAFMKLPLPPSTP